jgi:hypothetical protein
MPSGPEIRGPVKRVVDSTSTASAMSNPSQKIIDYIKGLPKNKAGELRPIDGKYIQYEVVDKNFILKYKDKETTIPLKYIQCGSFDILARAVHVLHEDFAIPEIEDKSNNYNNPCNIEIPCKIVSTIKELDVGDHWFDESGRRLLKTDQCTINPQISKDRLVLCVFDNGETKWLPETTIVRS